MITALTVENWKSLESATLNIDPLSVLIGTNSSGKSNVLDALLFLNRISSGAMLTSALQGDGAFSALRGGVEWAARKPGDSFALGVTLRSGDSVEYQYRVECKTEGNRCELKAEQLDRVKYRTKKDGERKVAGKISLFKTDPSQDGSPTIVARLYNEKGGTPKQLGRANAVLFQLFGLTLRSEIQEGIEAVVAGLRNIFILDPIPSHMRSFSPLSDRLDFDAANIAGVLAALSDELKGEIEKTLTKYASRLPERDIARVWAETVGKFNSDAMLYCEEHLGSLGGIHVVDARGMSDGTLRFLAILTALLTRPKGSLLVVEEVDNGLHPSRSNLLLDMLKEVGTNRSVDVMVTTHNPALLDAMGTRMVPFITVVHRDVSTGVTHLTLLEDIEQLPKLLAQGPVGRLSSKGLIEGALKDQAEAVA
ncbi:AAA family ATPase [Caulobacter segnis]|uniref:AAA family ATPase n=1 Tax=Caulobacter segnis TaxID=88688 RepID=UPI001CBF5BAC|nr:ATP-binding protein [Caulobacter segnis]UAL08567.1 AAA family ATPase [Caulobacter segnis]